MGDGAGPAGGKTGEKTGDDAYSDDTKPGVASGVRWCRYACWWCWCGCGCGCGCGDTEGAEEGTEECAGRAVRCAAGVIMCSSWPEECKASILVRCYLLAEIPTLPAKYTNTHQRIQQTVLRSILVAPLAHALVGRPIVVLAFVLERHG